MLAIELHDNYIAYIRKKEIDSLRRIRLNLKAKKDDHKNL